jgi:hypothetical protein
MDLVREILLVIDNDPRMHGGQMASGANCFTAWAATDFGLDPAVHSDEEVAYHVRMLIEKGFVTGKKEFPVVRALTWKGHDFLNTIRDGEIWHLTKETSAKTGAASFQALFAIGTAVVKQKLAEHGIPWISL